MIAVDTSALMAIVLNEPSADACMATLEAEDRLLISAGTVAEVLIVAGRRNRGDEIRLLIGGLGNNSGIWDPLAAQLSDFETIAVDAPGMGHSSTPLRPLSMFELADFYACLLRTLGISKAAVCGLSFGGAVAQQLAYQSPSLVEKLILCGTGPGVGGFPGSPVALTELAMPWRYYAPSWLRSVAPRNLPRAGWLGPNRRVAPSIGPPRRRRSRRARSAQPRAPS